MAAYLIGHITVKDAELWDRYVEGVQKSLQPYEAQIIFRGKQAKVLTGEHTYENTVVIQFPEQEILQNWYYSKKYQDLIPIRDKAADVVIICYDA
ncbi:MAG: DUF1330 domain-containing protein [Deltaproteobacteria bacterium]|nr:MAG: DUF1330 domain-containing protein [Deltaproteobacteria bacterium]